jgi:hypothetical protein
MGTLKGAAFGTGQREGKDVCSLLSRLQASLRENFVPEKETEIDRDVLCAAQYLKCSSCSIGTSFPKHDNIRWYHVFTTTFCAWCSLKEFRCRGLYFCTVL